MPIGPGSGLASAAVPAPFDGDSGIGPEDDDADLDDLVEFRPPLPPDDRLWRHPSEMAQLGASAPPGTSEVSGPPELSGAPGAAGARASWFQTPRLLTTVAVSALIGATLSLGVVAALGGFDDRVRVVERPFAVPPVSTLDSQDATVAAIAERTSRSVLALSMRVEGEVHGATAVVYRGDGYVVTVAPDAAIADELAVIVKGRPWPATVVGTDPLTGVVVLHIDAAPLDAAVLGTTHGVGLGDDAIVVSAGDEIGNGAVSTGLVSAIGQEHAGVTGAGRLHDMILLDLELPPVPMGACLVDTSGAVVGLTAGEDEGFGIALPIDVVDDVTRQIIENGEVSPVWLGIGGTDATTQAELPAGTVGALVTSVVDGGPAAVGGIAVGDVVVGVDGEPVTTMGRLVALLRGHRAGDEVTVTVVRDGQPVSVVVTLAERA